VIRPATELEPKHFDWTMSVNARSLLELARAARPHLSEGSAIVAISSLGSERVLPGYAAVGASKAAMEALVRYLGVELSPAGIRVNAVSAGVVDTGALEHFPMREEMLRAAKEGTPAGRMVTPEDVAAAVRFLLSEDSWMVRGHTLVVDGGYSLPA
jgi:enoyl-[acyl-carrier protein] reductase III